MAGQKDKWFSKLNKLMSGAAGAKKKKGKDINILVVDDEVGPREALRMILKDRYKVHMAEGGKEALAKIAEMDMDIVLMDISMPDINGIELLRSIKKTVPDTEVVLITGYPSMDSAIEAMKYGAYDYIVKPFNKEKIDEVIQKGILKRTRLTLEKDLLSNLEAESKKKDSEGKE